MEIYPLIGLAVLGVLLFFFSWLGAVQLYELCESRLFTKSRRYANIGLLKRYGVREADGLRPLTEEEGQAFQMEEEEILCSLARGNRWIKYTLTVWLVFPIWPFVGVHQMVVLGIDSLKSYFGEKPTPGRGNVLNW